MKKLILFFSIPLLTSMTTKQLGTIRDDVDKQKYLDYAKEKQFDCVGQIRNNKKNIGSFVLIDKNWLLTAAHNFDDGTTLNDVCFIIQTDTFKGVQLVIHPQYKKSDVDLALVKLDKSVLQIQPATIYKGKNELGAQCSFVGFGVFGTGLEPTIDTINNIKIAGTNTIDQIGGKVKGVDDFKKHFLLYDFDQPNDTTANKMGNATPLQLEYQSNGGDSGGGLFIKENNIWYLAGIIAQTTFAFKMTYDPIKKYAIIDNDSFNRHGTYGSIDTSVRLSLFYDWTQTTMTKQ